MYLADTDWLIQALKRHPHALEALEHLSLRGVAISWISVAELYEGPIHSPFPESRLIALKHFICSYRRLTIDDAIAEEFARTRSSLRRSGAQLADLDLLIAATALVHDLTLLTFNHRHYARIPMLRLYPLA